MDLIDTADIAADMEAIRDALWDMHPPGTGPDVWMQACHPERIARLLDALADAQTDAKESERLSIIADELIAGFGEPGRALAEMIRQGVTALESHAAHLLRDVRAQNLEEAARACKAVEDQPLEDGSELYYMGRSSGAEACAAAIRALASTPEVAK